MSMFDEISNRIGWFGEAKIPTVEGAKEMLGKILENQCPVTFEAVLKIHRFAPAPQTEDELVALDLICQAYKIGSLIFRSR